MKNHIERENRIGEYKIDEEFESLLFDFNKRIINLDKEILKSTIEKQLPPIVFICFAPRTGSTVISQYFSRTQEFSFISNFVARFWNAPAFGFLLENKLNLADPLFSKYSHLTSSYGVSQNHAMPHEFGFFWNQILTSEDNHYCDSKILDNNIKKNIRNYLNFFRKVSGKPFFIKNGIASLNTHLINDLFPDAFFVIVSRNIMDVAKSIYIGRKEMYGDVNKWFSIKPSTYTNIIDKHINKPFDQIIEQINATYEDIERGLNNSKNVIKISYEEFCENPIRDINRLFSFIGHMPKHSSWETTLEPMKPSKGKKLTTFEKKQLQSALIKNLHY